MNNLRKPPKVTLLEAMKTGLNSDDVRLLCFYLKEMDPRFNEYEDITSSSLRIRILELIEYCNQREMVPALLNVLREYFPYMNLQGYNVPQSYRGSGTFVPANNADQASIDIGKSEVLINSSAQNATQPQDSKGTGTLTKLYLTKVQAISLDCVWAFGAQGVTLYYNGSMWKRVSTPTKKVIYDGYMISVDMGWAVGEGGIILRYKSGEWLKESSPTSMSLRSLHMVSSDEGWAVGDDNTLIYYSGGTWRKMDKPAGFRLWQPHLGKITMLSKDSGWVVGTGGTILHYVNGKWMKMRSPVNLSIAAVCVIDSNGAWAVGLQYWCDDVRHAKSYLLHYDGVRWERSYGPIDPTIYSLQMLSNEDGWAVGKYGTILQCNQGTWMPVDSPTNKTLTSVCVNSVGEGWAVGAGVILHYQNGVWSEYQQ